MSDNVYLLINGKLVENFKSYDIDADLFAGAAAFSLELARPETIVTKGSLCELYVNDTREYTGIVDVVHPSYDKTTSKLSISGRDLMGILVDADAEDWITLKNQTLKDVTELLLQRLPFVNRKTVQYQENVTGRIKGKGAAVGIFDTQNALSQIEPGMKVFDVLQQYAKSKGLLFFCMPDGTLVFSRPRSTGEAAFSLTHKVPGSGNNVIFGDVKKDSSKGYSKVTVIGQKQGQDVFTPTQVNIEATVTDPDFPFYKPAVLKDEYGGENPALQARMAMEKMKQDGFRATYTVEGHSQNGKNWTINELCKVLDEQPNVNLDGVFLIYGRTFRKSKEAGTTTELRLGLPGMTV